LLKVLVLPLPIYLIAIRSILNGNLGDTVFQNIAMALCGIPLAWTLFWLVAKKLYVTKDAMRFGLINSYKSADLLEISTEKLDCGKDVALNLLFKRGEKTKKETIKISNLKEHNKEKLLRAIEQFAPAAKISSSARSLLVGQWSGKNALKLGEAVVLPYDTHPFVGQFLHMLAGYQNYFWLAWIVCNAALVLAFYIVFTLVPYFASADYAAVKPIVEPIFLKFIGMFFLIANVASIGSSNVGGIIWIALASALAVLSVPHILGANKVTVDKERIALAFEGAGIKRIVSAIKWSDIDQISLQESIGARNKTAHILEFASESNQAATLSVDLNALGDYGERLLLSQAIEKYAPHVKIDARAIATLRPATDASYTDIWLSGLSKAPHSTALVPLLAGDIIGDGRYQIISRFMLGGQSTVYLASSEAGQNVGQQQLIIKETILPVFDDHEKTEHQIKRFQAEAEFLRRLEHPGLVKVLDSFVDGTRGFIVMEKIEGTSLQSLVERRGALEREKILDLADQMCEILSYLHAQSVVHRDFTPDNLILNEQGRLILIDFGVAQNASEHVTSTVVGKHAYMPPEQFRGQATERSDLYAMGGTLYFLLTGKEPIPLTKLDLPATIADATDTLGAQDNLSELIGQLTNFEEKNRPSSADLARQMLSGKQPEAEGATIKIKHPEREQEFG